MATATALVGANRTLILAGGIQKILGGLVDGRLKCQVDTIALTTDYAAASTVKLGSLPKGANLLVAFLMVTVAQTSLTFSLGNGDTAALFVTAGATGLQTALTPVVCGLAGYVVGAGTLDTYLLLTTAGATATAGTLTCAILYTID